MRLSAVKGKNFIKIFEKHQLSPENKKGHLSRDGLLAVVPAGIEPATQGFSVLCSTN